MSTPVPQIGDRVILGPEALQRLIEVLALEYRVIGPTVADGAVVLRDLASADDLPTGWIDEQEGGHYRLQRDESAGPFDHVVGPHSLKNFLFPPREPIARFERVEGGWEECDMSPLQVTNTRTHPLTHSHRPFVCC